MTKLEAVIQLSAEHFEVTVSAIIQSDKVKGARKKEYVVARQAAMRLIFENSDLSLKSIGKYFSDRDHSTVLHAITAIQDRLDTDKRFSDFYKRLDDNVKNMLNGKPFFAQYIWQNENVEPVFFAQAL